MPDILPRALGCALIVLCFSPSPEAQGQRPDPTIDVFTVLGSPLKRDSLRLDPRLPGSFAPDAAALMDRAPGGAVIENGPLSGQPQYRGLFGPRLNVTIDGQALAPGGPNYMDAPLHYAPKPLLESLEVTRGIASVSDGPGIGGAVNAELKTLEYTKTDKFETSGMVSATAQSVSRGSGIGGITGVSNKRHRFQLDGHFEDGDDIRFAGGQIRGSQYRRWSAGFGYGFKNDRQDLALSYRRHETGPTGNPTFPLDILFFETDVFRADYALSLSGMTIEARLGYSDVAHAMDNATTRPLPAGTPRIETPARGESIDFAISASHPMAGGKFKLGVDGSLTENSATVTRPEQPGFEIGIFSDAISRRYSGFAEWAGNPADDLRLEVGIRYDRIRTDSGAVFAGSSPPVPPPVQMLVRDFNAQDRSRTDHNLDAVAQLDYSPLRDLTFSVGVARKNRSPIFVERYAFLPIEVTAGLADGNNTIGDVGLDPETGYLVDAGVDYRSSRGYVSLRGYYHRINNYIQSTPFDDSPTRLEDGIDPATTLTSPLSPAGPEAFFAQFDGPGGTAPSGATEIVSLVNGDATPLRFSNVDGRLYGVDAAFGYRLSEDFAASGGALLFDGIISYVRGQRRDLDDDLYRIAPPRTILTLTYERRAWSVSVEGQIVGRQDNVSRTNGELPTDGYGLLNLYGQWRPTDSLQISAGIENASNSAYRNHLAGFNRTPQSDVALVRTNPFAALNPNARLPGSGIGGFLSIEYRF